MDANEPVKKISSLTLAIIHSLVAAHLILLLLHPETGYLGYFGLALVVIYYFYRSYQIRKADREAANKKKQNVKITF